jgi:hypothetical protein
MQFDPVTGLPTNKKVTYPGGTYDQSDVFSRTVDRGAEAYAGSGPYGGAAPGPLTIAGYTPDYGSLIQGDPGLQQLLKDLQAGSYADAASRNAAFQRSAIQFGMLPDIGKAAGSLGLSQDDLSGIFGPDTQRLAEQNTQAGLSTKARIEQQHQQNLRALQTALRQRGAVRSGEAGHLRQQEQTGYDRANYDSTNELLEYLSGLQAGYAAAERQRAMQRSQGMSEAAARVIATNPATGSKQAVYDPDTGLYRDADGNYYDASGNPAEPGHRAAAPPGVPMAPRSYNAYPTYTAARDRRMEQDLARYGL